MSYLSILRPVALLTVLSVLTLAACGGGSQSEPAAPAPTQQPAPDANVTLTPIDRGIHYPDASLALNAPQPPIPSGEVTFDFVVDGFNLGVLTANSQDKRLANSSQGQHIHLILNNDPYSAHYESSFQKSLAAGHYVVLAFLSRSWHESVKTAGASVVTQIVVGDGEHTMVDLDAPHLFYSRPKGTYVGTDTERVMLDFYLANVELGEGAFRIEATIDDKSFTLTDWQPYVIEGLAMGEHTIRLELIDPEGRTVESPFNPVERVITLTPE